MPRPALKPNQKRSQVVTLRFSPPELKEIERRADKEGKTTRKWAREVLLNA